MTDARWSAAALNDLEQLYNWLNQRSGGHAGHVVDVITAKTRWLCEHPLTGSPLDHGEMRKSLVAGTSYLIFYRHRGAEVEIVRIRHAAEDWQNA